MAWNPLRGDVPETFTCDRCGEEGPPEATDWLGLCAECIDDEAEGDLLLDGNRVAGVQCKSAARDAWADHEYSPPFDWDARYQKDEAAEAANKLAAERDSCPF